MFQLQILLTEYLDVQNVVDDSQFQTTVSLNEQTTDINVYFAKKKPQRQKNGLLFKFDPSAHTMSLNNYLKDHRYSSLNLVVSRLYFSSINHLKTKVFFKRIFYLTYRIVLNPNAAKN